MAKTRFFRVAVEGATTDGRSIERQWLLDAAQTYNRATYAARVNLEHIRGITPDGPFQAYGDVLSLRTETVDLAIGGKTEKRLALFAEIDALEPLVAMNQRAQKLYSSVELSPNFAGTGKAYLVGLAVTDSPASLGTELLQFAATQGDKNPLAGRKQDPANLFSAAEEVVIEVVDGELAETVNPDPTGIFASIKAMIEGFTGKPKAADPAPAVVEDPAPADAPAIAAFGVVLGQLTGAVEAMAGQVTTIAASATALTERLTKVETTLEATPITSFQHHPRAHSPRALATGGNTTGDRTDC